MTPKKLFDKFKLSMLNLSQSDNHTQLLKGNYDKEHE